MAVSEVLIVLFINSVYSLNVHRHPSNVGIIGGHNISIEKAPYMASLRLSPTYHYCGASIIHKNFILTAAHCILPNTTYFVQVGTADVNEGGALYDVVKIIKHELYNVTTSEYDICLVKINSSLTFSDKVNKIALAKSSLKLTKNSTFDITGWGNTKMNGDISQELLQVKIPIVTPMKCQLRYLPFKQVITKTMLCAGEPGKDSCQGDSGGPLTLNNKVQVGVTSFGAGCGTMPGVYTKISSMRPWILETIEKNI